MSFPTLPVNTSNLDSAADDPSLAREDLLTAVTRLNQIIAGANAPSGVPVLNSSGQLNPTTMPSNIQPASTLALIPATGIVSIQSILRLNPLSRDEVVALAGSEVGDTAMVSDGDSGDLCIAVFDGTDWLRVALGFPISDS
jgi:LysM repeat protein